MQRPLVPVFGETTKGTIQNIFYLLFVCCTKATLYLLNARMYPGFTRYSFLIAIH